ncbi:MAG TPA: SIS domain-containing protein, partial [Anaerolineales bacterium]|nr:SIS domain-containing protein [Anaerolineales bacterium]
MYQELQEQPLVIQRLLRSQRPAVERLADLIRQRAVTHVVIAARGTSDNAARYAQYLFGAMNGLTVALATPSLFTYYRRPPQFHNALVLGISQSGRSPDVAAVLAEARRQGALTAAITNDTTSQIARQGDMVLDLDAGEERSTAATKTYSAELATIAHLSAVLSRDP